MICLDNMSNKGKRLEYVQIIVLIRGVMKAITSMSEDILYDRSFEMEREKRKQHIMHVKKVQ